jgi:hypothetical protein
MSTAVQEIDGLRTSTKGRVTSRDARREREAVAKLAANITAWSREQGWTVRATTDEMPSGPRELPWLFITTPNGRIAVDPIDGDIIGAQGRVDLIAWPDLVTVMLLRQGDAWFARSESGSRSASPLSRETFVEIVNQLIVSE